MTVALRPHHLLCILTHVGEGYSRDFSANMASIIERITKGEGIEIVDGPDDICSPLVDSQISGSTAHCHRENVVAMDQAASSQIGKLLSLSIKPGLHMKLDCALIQTLRIEFAAMRVRSACQGCQWSPFCSSIASAEYAGVLL